MKIRQFFVICAFKKLPSEIICKIWVYMLDSCVDSIRAVYFRKVEINLHILRIFIDLTADIPSDLVEDWGLDNEYENWKEWQEEEEETSPFSLL